MDPLELPLSVVLALWAPLPSSRGPALVQGPDGAHEVRQDSQAQGPGLQEWLDSVRPLRRVAAVLTPSADGVLAQGRAAQAGQAVVLEGAAGAHLLVPQETGTNVIWHLEPLARPVPSFDAGQARREVHAATEEAIDSLIDMDLARERPDLADTLNDLVTAVLDPRLVPPSLEPRRIQLLERSLRLAGICRLALSDDGAAATAVQAQHRAEVLRPLLGVALRGAGAATDWWSLA